MLVKCKICGKQIDRDAAYKRIVNGKNWYFCSEKEFANDEQKKTKIKADKNAVFNEIEKIFGYRVQNSQLFKEWAVWNTLKSDEIITQYLAEKEDYLVQAIGRLPNVEYNKIRYFSTILKNSLHDFVPKVEVKDETPVIISDINYDIPKPAVTKRKSLSELEDEV